MPSTSPMSTVPPDLAAVVLRADGIGPFDFGSDMSTAASWLTEVLGPPTVVDVGTWPGLGFTFGAMVDHCSRQEVLSWPSVGLTVGFSDLVNKGDGRDCSQPELRLWAWNLVTADGDGSRLETTDGIGVGDTVAQLRSSVTAPVLMALNDSTFFPTGFYLPSGEYGAIAWDWISDLQQALNENGAHLAVDGAVGPKTRAAVEEYRIAHDLGSVADVLRALIEPPDDATVASISSDGWFWEFECGTLEQWGWGGC